VLILKIIGWLPFVIALSNIYGIQLMLPLGFDKQFFKVVATAAIINLCLIILLVPQYQAVGIAIATLVAEIFVSASFIIFLARKGERLI
jgi:PST family polysaccharide transporter